ncbi:MAG: hypothetical protein VX768_07350 [Planctomycetota bacterium]|nr:hypothetical protein [Planctomycetota bacterium]
MRLQETGNATVTLANNWLGRGLMNEAAATAADQVMPISTPNGFELRGLA